MVWITNLTKRVCRCHFKLLPEPLPMCHRNHAGYCVCKQYRKVRRQFGWFSALKQRQCLKISASFCTDQASGRIIYLYSITGSTVILQTTELKFIMQCGTLLPEPWRIESGVSFSADFPGRLYFIVPGTILPDDLRSFLL